MRNVYEGVAPLDGQGCAVITLPDYFTAINTAQYRYQLTPIGAPMPNLYVAQEVTGSVFRSRAAHPARKSRGC